MNDAAKPVKSLRDRVDPDGSFKQIEDALAVLRDPFSRSLLGLAPYAQDTIAAELEELGASLERMLAGTDAASRALPRLGWCMHGAAPLDEYHRAAQLADDERPDEAEAHLVEAWNANDLLRTAYRITTLYDLEDERGAYRLAVLQEALHCHELGLYPGR